MKLIKNISTWLDRYYFQEILLFLFALAIFIPNLNADFWNDELYTLKNYVFVPSLTILSDHYVPNNHIFFNALNNIFLQIVSVDSLFELMDSPWKLRMLPLSYALLTLFFTYKLALLFWNRTTALIGITILLTTLPFYYFALQIRGYMLSALLLASGLYYINKYIKEKSITSLLLTSILTSLLFYTITSNLLVSLGIIAFFGLQLIFLFFKNKNLKLELKNRYIISILLAVSFGLLLTLLFYLPQFQEVFNNEYVQGGDTFQIANLSFFLPYLLPPMLSARWVVLILFVVGVISNFSYLKKNFYSFSQLLTIFIVPIVYIYVRGGHIPPRMFVVWLPVFSLLMAVGISAVLDKYVKSKAINFLVVLILIAYTATNLFYQKENQRVHVWEDIQKNRRSQDLEYQYYSHHYKPLETLRKTEKELKNNPLPLIIMGCEGHGIPNYLEKFNIPYLLPPWDTKELSLDSLLLLNDSIYILTNHPSKYTRSSDYKATFITQEISYHNVIKLKKNIEMIDNLISKVQRYKKRYQDSVAIVLNYRNKNGFEDLIQDSSVFFVDKDINYASLFHHIGTKKYLLFSQSFHLDNPQLTGALIDGRNTEFHKLSDDGNELCLYTIGESTRYQTVYSQPTDSIEYLTPEKIYSVGYHSTVKSLNHSKYIEFKCQVKNTDFEGGLVILAIQREGKPFHSAVRKLQKFNDGPKEWNKVIAAFELDDKLNPEDELKVFIMNNKESEIWLKDIEVRVY